MTWRMEGTMQARMEGFDAHVEKGMYAAANYVAPLAESHMKANAPWTDRSGAARNGLRAKVVGGGGKVAIILYHSVPYGVYLETRWGGRFAIIQPTVAIMAPVYAKAVGRLVFGGAGT